MKEEELKTWLNLRREDLDPEVFAQFLAIQYFRRLITGGGSDFGRPEYEISLHPHHLERFLARASEMTWKNEHIKDKWQMLLRVLPRLNGAWEKGQALFQEDLARARVTPEEMEYLSHIDFAEDCYAYPRARKTY